MKNAYALQLQQKRKQEDFALVQKTLNYVSKVMTLALNKEGLGKSRIKRVNGYFDEFNNEYLAALNDGTDYAETKLNERYAQIMDEEF